MDNRAKEERNAYMRDYMAEYRKKNKERINAQKREWNKHNPDKLKEYRERYWERKAKEKSGV